MISPNLLTFELMVSPNLAERRGVRQPSGAFSVPRAASNTASEFRVYAVTSLCPFGPLRLCAFASFR